MMATVTMTMMIDDCVG